MVKKVKEAKGTENVCTMLKADLVNAVKAGGLDNLLDIQGFTVSENGTVDIDVRMKDAWMNPILKSFKCAAEKHGLKIDYLMVFGSSSSKKAKGSKKKG